MKLKAVTVSSMKRMKNQVKVKHLVRRDGKVKEKCVLLSTVTTTNKPASYLFSGSRKSMPGRPTLDKHKQGVALQTEMDRNGPKWTEMSRNGPKWAEMYRNGELLF